MSTRAIDPIGASRLHDVWAAYRAASVKPARESYTAHCAVSYTHLTLPTNREV